MRREFFPLFCQFFQIFVYIILNLAIGQLVGFGEDDREGYSIFSQPFHEFQVYFLRFQTQSINTNRLVICSRSRI